MSRIKLHFILGATVLLGLTITLVLSGGTAQAAANEPINISDDAGDGFTPKIENNSSAETRKAINSSNLNVTQLSESEYVLYDNGFENGFDRGNATGYSKGFIDGYMKNPDTPGYNPSADTFQRDKIIERDGYTFIFGEVKSDYVGMSWPENDTIKIEILSIETAGKLESLCDHEMAHQFFPDFDHSTFDTRGDDPIYKYSDDMDIKICDWLAKKLSGEGNAM